MTMKTIGQKIQSRRKELGITQQELADIAGVGINTLVAVERGLGNIRLSGQAGRIFTEVIAIIISAYKIITQAGNRNSERRQGCLEGLIVGHTGAV